MFNRIRGAGVATSETYVKSTGISGATTQDMTDYLKPAINKKPDLLIVHAGTNDITNNVPDSAKHFQEVINLAKEKNVSLAFSNLCKRFDKDSQYLEEVGKRNKVLGDVCRDNEIPIIDNSFFDESCVKPDGVHPTDFGCMKLALNVKKFLSNYNF